MRSQRGAQGRFSSLYGTSTLRLDPDFPYPPGGPRYERLVFARDGQLLVPLNEWYRLMDGIGAVRTRDTYLAVLRPWFGFLSDHGYQWNGRPEAVGEYTRLFLIEAGCALRAGRVDGWFIQATNRSPISSNGPDARPKPDKCGVLAAHQPTAAANGPSASSPPAGN